MRHTDLTAYSGLAVICRMADDAPDVAAGLFSSADAMGVSRGTSVSQYRTNVFFTGSGRNVSSATVTAPNGTARLIAIRNTDGDARMEVNGVAVTNANAATATSTISFILGQRSNSFGKVEVIEVLLYPAGLTDAQMASLFTYAKAQYPALFPA